MSETLVSQEEVRNLFEYVDGALYWKTPTGPRVKKGAIAGGMKNDGYRYITLRNKAYPAHRLIYLYWNGHMPFFVDHINGIKEDNKIDNLRAATRNQNGQNIPLKKNNSSGVKNVSWEKQSERWQVQLTINGKPRHFGCYKDLELASLIAYEAREKFHGTFANHGV